MKKIIDKKYVSLIKTINLNLSINLKNNKLGKKHSSCKGHSVEFSDYRPYNLGDDYRRIDWTALARFEKLFLKLYTEEQQAHISIFIDNSKSMSFEKKRELEIKLAALFAYTSLNEYDMVSIYFFNEKINSELKNINNKNAFVRIADKLETIKYDKNTRLLDSIREATPSLKNGYSFIISDFLYPHKLDEVLKILSYKKQKVVIFHVLNEDELGVNFASNLRLKDSETLEEINVEINENTKKLYLKTLDKYLKEIANICSKYKASYFLLNANQGIENFIKKLKNIS